MNKPKRLSICIASAIYAAGMATATADVSVSAFKPTPNFLKKVEITAEMKEMSDARRNRSNRLNRLSKDISNIPQVNVHRAINQKVDFKWDDDVTGDNTYIIEFSEQPIALYNGSISGLPASNARTITGIPSLLTTTDSYKINVNNANVINYKSYLEQKQQQHLAAVTNLIGNKVKARQTYQYALNGASIRLNQQQALAVSKLSGVRNITLSKNYELNTDVGPKHINADQIWVPNTLGLANKGEGIVVGIIDTGINSDHPSFAATAGDGYVHTNPRDKFYGDCEKEEFASMCNDKLIGVHSYPVITDTYWSPAYQDEYAYYETPPTPIRPENGEDYGGHGSHTASTTAGNELFDVPYTISVFDEQNDGLETELVFPHISGVAPRANIIAYKVCYDNDGSLGDQNASTEEWQGCPGEAIIAGIEDAITDGVDVINFSIGGGESSPWESPMEMAFLAAREAGISSALSAGNSGRYLVDHVSPWVTSVGATTHGRTIDYNEKTLGEFSGGDTDAPGYGSPLIGGGFTEGITGNIVLAANFTDPDPWDGFDAEMCNKPFPAGTFTSDQIVVCKRGEIARIDKAVNVQLGGAGGFILYNADYNQDAPWGTSEPSDPYAIPGILLPSSANWTLIPWLQSGTGHMGTINASTITAGMGEADYVADFSSRGPSITTPNSMVPNVGAPGVDIFAAFADDHPFTATPFSADYTSMSGTSMAAPHVAGAMALLTQLNPDWTPAEIQSALMMTAHSGTSADITGYRILEATVDDTGSGIIDVEAASRATLVMDENGENYRAANPNNGGNITALNEAYLFNTDCDFDCSWIRTFRATQDGSWHITMEEQASDGLPLLELVANPATFSLKKGEVQSVKFTASAKDINAVNTSITDLQFEGKVTITPENANMPSQHMPLRVKFNDDGLPNDLSIDIHRNNGSALSPRLYTKEVGDIKVNGLIKGKTQEHILAPYTLGVGTPESIAADAGIEQINFTVPEGTKRLVFEIIKQEGYRTNHETALDIGRDVNGDGLAQWTDEAICFSFSFSRDYCAIDYPEAGEYWALVGNYTTFDPTYDITGAAEPLILTSSLAIIPEGADDSLIATVSGNANGIDGYNVDMAWNTEGGEKGDVYYTAIEFGRDASNAGDVGIMGVRFEHQGDDVMITSSQTQGKTGDVVDFYVEAKENLSPSDREFTLTATIPEGMNLSEESIAVNSIYADMLSVDGNTITISGVQPSTVMTQRQYVWTTSENDAMCIMPYEDDDNQENWWDMAQFMQPTTIEGGAWDTFYLDTWNLSNTGSITHYGQKWEGTMGLNPAGFFFVDPSFYLNFGHAPMKYVQFPDTMIAALWHGSAVLTSGYDFNTGQANGMYVATTENNEIVLQWDGMEVNDWWAGVNGKYSAQTIFKTEPDYDEGAYEVLFGYKRLDASLNGQGSIGTRGFHGFRNPWAPNEGWNADTFAYDDVLEKVSENVLVCGDYQGPEQSAIRLSFSALVNNSAPGSDLEVMVTSDYANAEQIALSTDVKVNGNISMGHYNDITIDENAMVEGLTVIYAETNSTAKIITVSGDNVTGTMSGHSSGSMVDIMPNTNWYGMTEVTITVTDAANMNDKSSTSFMLTVISDGIALGCMDSTATNFDATANTDDSSCTFPVEAETNKSSSGGGSFGWLLLGLLPLAFIRRNKKLH